MAEKTSDLTRDDQRLTGRDAPRVGHRFRTLERFADERLGRREGDTHEPQAEHDQRRGQQSNGDAAEAPTLEVSHE